MSIPANQSAGKKARDPVFPVAPVSAAQHDAALREAQQKLSGKSSGASRSTAPTAAPGVPFNQHLAAARQATSTALPFVNRNVGLKTQAPAMKKSSANKKADATHVNRSAVDGKLVSNEFAKRNPSTTIRQTVDRNPAPKKAAKKAASKPAAPAKKIATKKAVAPAKKVAPLKKPVALAKKATPVAVKKIATKKAVAVVKKAAPVKKAAAPKKAAPAKKAAAPAKKAAAKSRR